LRRSTRAAAHVKINSRPTVLRPQGRLFLYADGGGNELRCKILDSSVSGEHVMFFAASDGQEDEEHSVIRPTA
jgi:hypothetical protein